MAYFETLGQLQSNDYTFQEIWSGSNPSNIVLDGTMYGFEVNDIILLIEGNSNGAWSGAVTVNPSCTNVSISGCNMINMFTFNTTTASTNISGSWWTHGASALVIYIGKITQNAITIIGNYPGSCISSVYRLCPR